MNFSNFTRRCRLFIDQTQNEASVNQHQQIIPEHLINILFKNNQNNNFKLLEMINFDKDMIEQYIKNKYKETPKVLGRNLRFFFSSEFVSILKKANKDLIIFGDSFISPEILLYSLTSMKDFKIAVIMANAGITVEKVENWFKLVMRKS